MSESRDEGGETVVRLGSDRSLVIGGAVVRQLSAFAVTSQIAQVLGGDALCVYAQLLPSRPFSSFHVCSAYGSL